MEHVQDFWKRNPVLVVGRPLERIPELRSLALHAVSAEEAAASAPGLEDAILLVHYENPSEAEEEARRLVANGFTREQILILTCSDESAEELRLRISVHVELSRQRRLEEEITAATRNGALRFLHSGDPSGETKALDRARYAHALGCALQLGPARHSRSIRLALFLALSAPERLGQAKSIRHVWPVAPLLEKRAELRNAPWPPEIPLELALAECAHLAAEAGDHAQFRDSFREKCARLPFRFRGELRDAVERCFAQLWKGGSRAA